MSPGDRSSASAIDRLVYRSRAFAGVARVAARGQQTILERRATDITDSTTPRSCLVVAPHPDDETLGAGATIARKRANGAHVRVVIVADGRHANPSEIIDEFELAALRQAEGTKACAALGVVDHEVRFAGFEDCTLDTQVDAVAEWIRNELETCPTEEVFLPCAIDGHPDHRAVNAAAYRALSTLANRPTVYEYPVWFWDAKAWLDRSASTPRKGAQLMWRPAAATFGLTVYAVRTEGFLDVKRAALAEHRSQITNLTGESSWPVMDESFVGQFFRPQELFFAASDA